MGLGSAVGGLFQGAGQFAGALVQAQAAKQQQKSFNRFSSRFFTGLRERDILSLRRGPSFPAFGELAEFTTDPQGFRNLLTQLAEQTKPLTEVEPGTTRVPSVVLTPQEKRARRDIRRAERLLQQINRGKVDLSDFENLDKALRTLERAGQDVSELSDRIQQSIEAQGPLAQAIGEVPEDIRSEIENRLAAVSEGRPRQPVPDFNVRLANTEVFTPELLSQIRSQEEQAAQGLLAQRRRRLGEALAARGIGVSTEALAGFGPERRALLSDVAARSSQRELAAAQANRQARLQILNLFLQAGQLFGGTFT